MVLAYTGISAIPSKFLEFARPLRKKLFIRTLFLEFLGRPSKKNVLMSSESTRRHVFISHHHKDDAAVDKMTRLLQGHGSDTRNSSIRAKPANQERLDRGLVKDATIRRLLRMKISWAGVVVVVIGKETHRRPWVNWEIQQAEKQGKRIVGVWEQGGKDEKLPENLRAYADAIVGWQGDQILGAIDGTINNWNNPDGSSMPQQTITRISCQ